ncbi:FHA domain-containing protein [Roseateles sp.]|uniref:FHA domain-containing protein n=1 Tax=Roseateles sp. TaxID=1971397 RepID=UPI0031E3B135
MDAVIEIVDRDGHCRETHKIRAWPLRIGRAPESDLVLSDPHVAGTHALLHWDEEAGGAPRLQLLPSRNGGWLDGRRLDADASTVWPAASTLQLGTTRLRLRTSLDPLPDEQPLNRADEPVRREARPAWALPALLAVWLLTLWATNWASGDGSASWVDTVSAILAPLGLVLVWAGLWALVTQVFRHWFAFGAHLWRALVATVALQLLEIGVPLAAYAFNLPRLQALETLAMSAGAALLLWWHASVVWPRASRRLGVGIAAMAIVGLVLTVGRRSEQQYWIGPNYMATLPPPALRVASPKTVDDFVDGLQALEAPLKQQAKKRNEQDVSSGDDE